MLIKAPQKRGAFFISYRHLSANFFSVYQHLSSSIVFYHIVAFKITINQ